jgi:hypothetical protein
MSVEFLPEVLVYFVFLDQHGLHYHSKSCLMLLLPYFIFYNYFSHNFKVNIIKIPSYLTVSCYLLQPANINTNFQLSTAAALE